MISEKISGLDEGFHEVAGGLGHLHRCVGSRAEVLVEWEAISQLCLIMDSGGHLWLETGGL